MSKFSSALKKAVGTRMDPGMPESEGREWSEFRRTILDGHIGMCFAA